jgi:hypothetical protein
MANTQAKQEGVHFTPEYIEKQVLKLPGLNITEFKKGICFLCLQPTEDKDAFIHIGCGHAYEDKKKENLKIFMESQKGVKSR